MLSQLCVREMGKLSGVQVIVVADLVGRIQSLHFQGGNLKTEVFKSSKESS